MATASKVTGGAKLRAFIRKARAAQATGPKGIEVGFYARAKYQDGTPVTLVAAQNEFGRPAGRLGAAIPERPFFRNSLLDAEALWMPILKAEVDPATMAVTRRTAGRLGVAMVGRVQLEITRLKTPPNAPGTIARKNSSNPLIDTGFMRASVTWLVIGP